MSPDDLEKMLGKYMNKKVRKAWPESERGPGVNSKGEMVVAGLQLGNVHISVQPLLGVEGDPMRLLFERDLTPHPQYCACYEYMQTSEEEGGLGTQAVVHLGMHGTVGKELCRLNVSLIQATKYCFKNYSSLEWLPGQPLGNDRQSWSDELLGGIPNIYVYAANNPSESILAKRRGYGTLVSYNVPPYGRAGLYLELAALKDLVNEYRTAEASSSSRKELRDAIFASCEKAGISSDVPLKSFDTTDSNASIQSITDEDFDLWVSEVANYLVELEERLFSSGLHTLGSKPTDHELSSYLNAYFNDRLSDAEVESVIATYKKDSMPHADGEDWLHNIMSWLQEFPKTFMGDDITLTETSVDNFGDKTKHEAVEIAKLLSKNTEELDSVVNALDGGYVLPAPGGDLLRDGTSVLPTGRNIHALDPYRMPSALAWARGSSAAEEIIKQHQSSNNGAYPETVGE